MSFETTMSDDDTVNGTIEIKSRATIEDGSNTLCRILSPLPSLHIKPKASSLETEFYFRENQIHLRVVILLLILLIHLQNYHFQLSPFSVELTYLLTLFDFCFST